MSWTRKIDPANNQITFENLQKKSEVYTIKLGSSDSWEGTISLEIITNNKKIHSWFKEYRKKIKNYEGFSRGSSYCELTIRLILFRFETKLLHDCIQFLKITKTIPTDILNRLAKWFELIVKTDAVDGLNNHVIKLLEKNFKSALHDTAKDIAMNYNDRQFSSGELLTEDEIIKIMSDNTVTHSRLCEYLFILYLEEKIKADQVIEGYQSLLKMEANQYNKNEIPIFTDQANQRIADIAQIEKQRALEKSFKQSVVIGFFKRFSVSSDIAIEISQYLTKKDALHMGQAFKKSFVAYKEAKANLEAQLTSEEAKNNLKV